MYCLDLTDYQVDYERFERDKDDKAVLKKGSESLNVKDELYSFLRIPGLFQGGVQLCEAVDVARLIRDCKQDSIELNDKDMKLIRTACDKLIAREHNPAANQVALGGARYEELIMRVFRAGKVDGE